MRQTSRLKEIVKSRLTLPELAVTRNGLRGGLIASVILTMLNFLISDVTVQFSCIEAGSQMNSFALNALINAKWTRHTYKRDIDVQRVS